jgi:hypothetical protein
MANNSQSNYVGSFVPTTEIWDVAQVYQTEVNSPEFKELLVRMYQNLNRMSLALNTATKGYYDTQGEFVTGSVWYPKPGLNSQTSRAPAYRQELRVVVRLPQVGGFALPATTTITQPHNIMTNSGTLFVNLRGMANDTIGLNYYPINYSGTNTVSAYADGTYIYVTNNTAINFTVCDVVIEFLQN